MDENEATQLAEQIRTCLPEHLQVEVVSHYGVWVKRYKVHIWHLVPDPRETWEWWINTPAEWTALRLSTFATV